MATSTINIVEASSTESFMLPGMASPEPDSSGRLVRFDKECVLIPEQTPRAKLPLVVTKSVALPLWKRRAYPTLDSDIEDPFGSSPQPSSPPEDSRLIIKVPIPLFRRRSSRSPTRGRSVSSSPVISKTLPSCLAHRSPTTSPSDLPLSPVRRTPEFYSIYHRRKEGVTVPLRACCEACERATEESVKGGDKWEEKFTRGARRRRSASLDNQDINSLFRLPSQQSRTSSLPTEFAALSTSLDNAAEFGSTPTFALTVDEVDKRRKSIDLTKETLETILPAPSSSQLESASAYPFPSPGSRYVGDSRYSRLSQPYDRELPSSSGSSSSASDELLMPDIFDPRHRLRSSPIEEEDEAQLFPLPSPRRSPASTPSPSNSPRVSPVPSPTGSTSCLPSSSRENVALKNSSQESLLKASLSRKPPATYLSAPTLSIPRKASPTSTRSSSPLAAPNGATLSSAALTTTTSSKRVSLHGLDIPAAPTSAERASSNPLSPRGPRPPLIRKGSGKETPTPPSSEGHSASSTPSISPLTPLVPVRLATTATTSISTTIAVPSSSTLSTPASFPSHSRHTSSPPEPITINTSHTALSFHAQSTSAGTSTSISSSPPSAGVSTTHVPGASPGRRKPSFTLPFIRAGEALREVSVDVLRGVSSISGGAGVVGSV